MLHVHWPFWKTYCALRKSEVPDFRLSGWVEASWILRFASFLSILFLYPSNKEKTSFKLSFLLLLALWQLACQMSWSLLADTGTAQLKCSQLNKSPLSEWAAPFMHATCFCFRKKPKHWCLPTNLIWWKGMDRRKGVCTEQRQHNKVILSYSSCLPLFDIVMGSGRGVFQSRCTLLVLLGLQKPSGILERPAQCFIGIYIWSGDYHW